MNGSTLHPLIKKKKSTASHPKGDWPLPRSDHPAALDSCTQQPSSTVDAC